MSLIVLGTDILSLYQRGDSNITLRANAHPAHELAITVITVEEELAGWYSLIRKVRDADALARAYQHLAEAIPLLPRWQMLLMTRNAIDRYETLRSMKLNVRKMDLRIAAIVLEHRATLATRNSRDFQRVPGLVTLDWTV